MIDRTFLDKLPHELKEVWQKTVRIFSYIEAYLSTLTPMTTSSSKLSKKDTKQASLTDQSANLEDVDG